MAGTVTGKNAKVWIATHAAGTPPSFTYGHSDYGMGDFTLNLNRATIEQDLIGEAGNYFDQGKLSLDGSLMAAKFATSGIADLLENVVDGGLTNANTEFLAISGCVSAADGTNNFISWYLVSCQCTGFDVSLGDADTISEASIDFVHMLPQNISYDGGCVMDG